MHKLFIVLLWLFSVLLIRAQTSESIISEIKTINTSLANKPCNTGKGQLISNRAMNIFLANKAGHYLATGDNLTLYKNSTVFNTAEGLINVNHSLYTAKGIDDKINNFTTIGVQANIADAFSAISSGRRFNNQLGAYLKQTWISKGNTCFNSCTQGSISQKNTMDALRTAILHTLGTSINNKAMAFENSLKDIDTTQEIPGQDIQMAKETMRKKFYTDLQEEYEFQYADLQSETLTQGSRYNLYTISWTSISIYIPLITENFNTANSPTEGFVNRHAYPIHLSVNHTRLFESSRLGKLFLNISVAISYNNSKDSYGLNKITFEDYKSRGGTDTIPASSLKANGIYIGNYKSFFTPWIKAQVAYLPTDWHWGISLSIEQNFGQYNALNGIIGIPIVLINKKAEPAINFEFQIRFLDMTGKIDSDKITIGKTSIGLSLGIPFSKIAY